VLLCGERTGWCSDVVVALGPTVIGECGCALWVVSGLAVGSPALGVGCVIAVLPRAASVAAIAAASGAPVGTLYHRFGNRNGVLTAAWLRALERLSPQPCPARRTGPG
jgi:hypothetical protein